MMEKLWTAFSVLMGCKDSEAGSDDEQNEERLSNRNEGARDGVDDHVERMEPFEKT